MIEGFFSRASFMKSEGVASNPKNNYPVQLVLGLKQTGNFVGSRSLGFEGIFLKPPLASLLLAVDTKAKTSQAWVAWV